MKYLTALILAVFLSLGTIVIPLSADTGSGVSIPLTVTVTGSSSGSGNYYGGGYPYTEKQKEILETEDTPYGSSYLPPAQTYIPIPEPTKTSTSGIAESTTSSGPLLTVPIVQSSGTEAGIVLLILVILAFAILVFLWYRQRKYRQY